MALSLETVTSSGGKDAQVMVLLTAPLPPSHCWLPSPVLTLPIFREDHGPAGLEVVTRGPELLSFSLLTGVGKAGERWRVSDPRPCLGCMGCINESTATYRGVPASTPLSPGSLPDHVSLFNELQIFGSLFLI